jgi:molybdenum cofactor synthesis domain-containing protein
MKSAVLVIGNEVLAGKVSDINSNFFTKALWDLGAPVKKVEIIPDEFDLIVERVQWLSQNFDYLFVTGGIGATHDDLTRQAVSAAMHVPCVRHDEAIRIMEEHYGEKLDETQKEMAGLPQGCKLIDNPVSFAPGFYIQNIFVFPGFPEMIRDMFPSVIPLIKGNTQFYEEIKTQYKESEYAEYLRKVSEAYTPHVEIGSYPKLPPSPFKTLISVTSTNAALVKEVVDKIRSDLKIK